jgi:hypothetical protein
MDDMNGIMTGSFSEKDRLKYQIFEQNLKNFKAEVANLINTHVQARSENFLHLTKIAKKMSHVTNGSLKV